MVNNHESIEKEPFQIADGVFWVGYSDEYRGLHCNPYLIIEGDEAVLIDPGNRDDFSTVMLKILRTGIEPSKIQRVIYSHYDPDLCGSLPQFEAIINSDSLKIISHEENNLFINYYSSKTEKLDYRDLGGHFDFATGRRLEFYATPFCHQPGSFVTYDKKTKTLFTSDLFASFDNQWTLFLELDEACRKCQDLNICHRNLSNCPLRGHVEFHQKIMTSNRAMEYTLKTIEKLDIDIIAPQHGSVITAKEDIKAIIRLLATIEDVGIDYVLSEESK
jgi:flavorubredoxin